MSASSKKRPLPSSPSTPVSGVVPSGFQDPTPGAASLDLNDWDPVATQLPEGHQTIVTVMRETHKLAVFGLPADQETHPEKQTLYLPGMKAFSLHWEHIIPMVERKFWLTGKTDGIRALLKIERHAVYLLSRTAGVWRLKNRKSEREFLEHLPNTLLDGELLPTPVTATGPMFWDFKAFDCIQFKGKAVSNEVFQQRYRHVQECVEIMTGVIQNRTPETQAELEELARAVATTHGGNGNGSGNGNSGPARGGSGLWITLSTKLWVPGVRISEVLSTVYIIDHFSEMDEEKEAMGLHRTDGLILMDPASHYKHHERNHPLLKWKPKHTIDLIGFFHRKSENHVFSPAEDEEGCEQTGDFVRLYEYVVVRGNRGPTPGSKQFHCVAEEKEEIEWLEYVGSAPVNDLWRDLVQHYTQPGMPPRNCLVMEVDLDNFGSGQMEMLLPRADKKTAPNWNEVVKDTLHSVDENITLPELTYIFHHAQEICPDSFPGTGPATDVPIKTFSRSSGDSNSSSSVVVSTPSTGPAAGQKRVHSETETNGEASSSSSSSSSAAAGEGAEEDGPGKKVRMADGSSAAVGSTPAATTGEQDEKKEVQPAVAGTGKHEVEIPSLPPFSHDRRWLELTKSYDSRTKLFLHLAALMLEHWRKNPLLEFEARLCRQNKPRHALTHQQFHNVLLPVLLKDPAWQEVQYQLIYEESRTETSGKIRVADIRTQKAWFDQSRRRWMIPALQNPQPQGGSGQGGGGSPNTPGLQQMLHGNSGNATQRTMEAVRKSNSRLQQLNIPGGQWTVRLSTKKEQPMPKLQAQIDADVQRQSSHGGGPTNFFTGALGLGMDGTRLKARWSFIRKGIRYDMSEVMNQSQYNQHTTYEAEVELHDELRNHQDGLQAPKDSELYGMPHLILAQRFFFKVEYLLRVLGQQQQQQHHHHHHQRR